MISLQIEVETTKEFFDTLRELLAGTAAPAESNVVAMTPAKGGRGKAKPVEVPKVEEKTVEPEPEVEDTVGDYDADQAEVDELANKLEEPAKAEPEGPKLTQDNVRALSVRYANACAPGDAAKDPKLQDARRQAFSELTKHFGVQKFTEIPIERLPEVVAYVTEQRAKRGLAADAVTD